MTRAREREAHPLSCTPTDHSDLSRWESVTVVQLRTGRSPLTRDTLLRLRLAGDDTCPACGEPDSAEHLLTDGSAAYTSVRGRLWGFTPTMEKIFADPPPPQDSGVPPTNGAHRPPRPRGPAACRTEEVQRPRTADPLRRPRVRRNLRIRGSRARVWRTRKNPRGYGYGGYSGYGYH